MIKPQQNNWADQHSSFISSLLFTILLQIIGDTNSFLFYYSYVVRTTNYGLRIFYSWRIYKVINIVKPLCAFYIWRMTVLESWDQIKKNNHCHSQQSPYIIKILCFDYVSCIALLALFFIQTITKEKEKRERNLI